MGLFGMISSKEVDAFAKALAQDIAKRYPPSLDAAKEKRISQSRISKVLEEAYGRAIRFRDEKRLGVYKKARLGNTFRWELKELGYSEHFVETATEGLVVYIARKSGSQDPPGKTGG